MKLKIILVPTLVILTLILAIGFIKPDYDTLIERKALLVQRTGEVAKIESVKANIKTLVSELEGKRELEEWSARYYPETMDQERTIDSFNFTALQSGLVIQSMEMKEIIAEKTEATDIGGPLTSIPGEAAPAEGTPVAGYQSPTPNSYVAQVRVKGNYENIKNFMDRVSRMDRMSALRVMSISIDTENENKADTGEVVAATDQLIGAFEARFDYVKSRGQQNALSIPLFDQSTLATVEVEKAKTWASSAIPTLNVGQSGRANPFQ